MFVVSLVPGAFAHSWYPMECCNATGDCHPVACDELVETKDGIRWKDLLFKDAQVRPTKDGQCHVCERTFEGTSNPHHGYCVFVQPAS